MHAAAREGSLDTAFVIDTLDAWAATRTRPTVLVLDNAHIHHSAALQARLQHWEDQNVHLFYLPTYSPPSTKLKPSGVRLNTSGYGPKPTLASRRSRPSSGTSSTGLDNNHPVCNLIPNN
ncbi:transposase [Hymenobacter nivis]|uniref:Tc1-like transposase DDE domain-containing protein n=1 Tax=Hymenobacter nivis TaxID=1850093 RepID=A0A2Z3GKD4_9BACT|nr:transposase [Hymenobacter nivis]AWM31596.1 hypothetical protein DDQ68_01600 [Hymenobacter nivis]